MLYCFVYCFTFCLLQSVRKSYYGMCFYYIILHFFYICFCVSCSWLGVLDTTLCNKVCQWLATGLWFSPGTPVSSANKTDCHGIAEILLKVMWYNFKQEDKKLNTNLWTISKLFRSHLGSYLIRLLATFVLGNLIY